MAAARKRKPATPKHPPIRQSLEDVVAELGELNAERLAVVTVARAVADQLDAGAIGNAALVKQYRDLLGGLAVAEEAADPIREVLSRILNSPKA